MYVHWKSEVVTVKQNSLNYGGGKIIFHHSVIKACFVFRNPHCPILKTALHRLQLRIMSSPAGIRLQSVLSGRTEFFLSGAPLDLTLNYSFVSSTTLPFSFQSKLSGQPWLLSQEHYFATCSQIMLITSWFNLTLLGGSAACRVLTLDLLPVIKFFHHLSSPTRPLSTTGTYKRINKTNL